MENNKLKTVITVFSMLLCFGVFAQGPPRGGQGGGREQGPQRDKPNASDILSKLDTNNDDVIDKEEASEDRRGKIKEDFDIIDANDDELIDLEELKASLNGKKPKKVSAEKLIKKIDDNGDGTLNKLEVADKKNINLLKDFDKIDSNNDGELNLEELKGFYAKNDKPRRRRKD